MRTWWIRIAPSKCLVHSRRVEQRGRTALQRKSLRLQGRPPGLKPIIIFINNAALKGRSFRVAQTSVTNSSQGTHHQRGLHRFLLTLSTLASSVIVSVD